MFNLAVVIILSYLVGSIPVSIIISRYVRDIDIRKHGSGNAGGTNVFRVLGWKYGVLTIFLDATKGAIAVVLIARLYLGDFPFPNATPFDDFTLVQIFAGLTAVLGHIWSIFAEFKGGKGIATGLGFLITLITIDMLLALVVFVIVVSLSRYISLGSVSAALSIPIIMVVRENIFNVDIAGYHTILPFVILVALLVTYTHRVNITRLFNGVESRITLSKKSKQK